MVGSESDIVISREELERRKRQRSTTPDDRRTRCPACGSLHVVAQLQSPQRPVPRTADYSCRRCGEAFDEAALGGQIVTDGGVVAIEDPHEEPLLVTEADGLRLPQSYIGHDGGLVVRMPNGGTIDFKPREWRALVGNVRPSHFGEVNEDGPNSLLGPYEVSLKKYGEPAEVFAVEVRS